MLISLRREKKSAHNTILIFILITSPNPTVPSAHTKPIKEDGSSQNKHRETRSPSYFKTASIPTRPGPGPGPVYSIAHYFPDISQVHQSVNHSSHSPTHSFTSSPTRLHSPCLQARPSPSSYRSHCYCGSRRVVPLLLLRHHCNPHQHPRHYHRHCRGLPLSVLHHLLHCNPLLLHPLCHRRRNSTAHYLGGLTHSRTVGYRCRTVVYLRCPASTRRGLVRRRRFVAGSCDRLGLRGRRDFAAVGAAGGIVAGN
jgi:hypothetical protein